MAHKSQSPRGLDPEILKKMKEGGLKLTQSRIKILELLAEKETAITPSEIFTLLTKRSKSGDVDRVTVYRILEKFKELGVVHTVDSNKYVYCLHQACKHDNHFILICSSCRQVQEVGGESKHTEALTKFLKKEEGFKLETQSMVLNGLCSQCS